LLALISGLIDAY